MSIYLELTRQFHAGRLRAVICSEQGIDTERAVAGLPLRKAHRRAW
jgi:hypothetical protein